MRCLQFGGVERLESSSIIYTLNEVKSIYNTLPLKVEILQTI